MSAYPAHDRALAYAIHVLGVHETPDGSNRGPIQVTDPPGGVDFFQQHDFLNGGSYPWCIDLILTAWEVGARRPLPYKTAGAYDLLRWAHQAGWVRPVSDLVPGDPVIFNIGAGHGGLFERLEGSTVHTVDGNTSNRVQRRSRHVALVAGGIHVPETPVVPPKPAPEPFWLIVTSENGHRKLVFAKFATEKTILGLLPRLLERYGKNGFTITRGGVRKPKR